MDNTEMVPTELSDLRRAQQSGDHLQVLATLEAASVDSNPHLQLLRGISLAATGEMEAARPLLTVTLIPQSCEEYSDLGMARLLAGDPDAALGYLSDAMESGLADGVVYGRLAAAHLARNDLELSRACYGEAIAREPERAEWHHNLAGILTRLQRLDEALENYVLALHIKPDFQPSLQARDRLLVALDRTDEVVSALEESVATDPDNAELKIRLARTLHLDNRFTEAIALLVDALLPLADIAYRPDASESSGEESEPPNVDRQLWEEQLVFRAVLAEFYRERSMFPRALLALNQILALKPEQPVPLISSKCQVLGELGRYDQARALLDGAEEEHPDALPLKASRAALFSESGDYAAAEALQRELLETYPGDTALRSALAQTLLWTGHLEEAADLFEEAARQNPMAFASMVNAKRMPEDEATLEVMASLAENVLLGDPARCTMAFALSEVHDKKKNIEPAWHFLDLANRLTNKSLRYSAERNSAHVDALINAFSAEFLSAQHAIRDSDRTPIFVVGMPRSGTTLTEQILCSHPSVFGAGELDLMPRIQRLMPKALKTKEPFPQCIRQITPHLREEAARFYLHGLLQYDEELPFVVDKLPHNFEALGLISMIFPKAKIIHVRRDPRDNALSNLQQNFKAKQGKLGYAFDQVNAAHHINDYHRLMNHWREVLPIPMLEFFYEDLVTDQEQWTRVLLDFIGVDWDESVRDFHKTERAVRTASVGQVRQPMYQTSKQKWRRYEAHLQPLLETLDPAAVAPWV
ncbi:MAG: tetratricopeptide (TPR) repeat protein [Halieaceae bacterium]|jgi:tetratricopeptide (TPR) repeat protein